MPIYDLDTQAILDPAHFDADTYELILQAAARLDYEHLFLDGPTLLAADGTGRKEAILPCP